MRKWLRMARKLRCSQPAQAKVERPSVGHATLRTASASKSEQPGATPSRCSHRISRLAADASRCSSSAPSTSMRTTAWTPAGRLSTIRPIAGSAVSSPASRYQSASAHGAAARPGHPDNVAGRGLSGETRAGHAVAIVQHEIDVDFRLCNVDAADGVDTHIRPFNRVRPQRAPILARHRPDLADSAVLRQQETDMQTTRRETRKVFAGERQPAHMRCHIDGTQHMHLAKIRQRTIRLRRRPARRSVAFPPPRNAKDARPPPV